jgi:hypothetical protein
MSEFSDSVNEKDKMQESDHSHGSDSNSDSDGYDVVDVEESSPKSIYLRLPPKRHSISFSVIDKVLEEAREAKRVSLSFPLMTSEKKHTLENLKEQKEEEEKETEQNVQRSPSPIIETDKENDEQDEMDDQPPPIEQISDGLQYEDMVKKLQDFRPILDSVHVASTEHVNISSPDTELCIDGVKVYGGSEILLKDQNNPIENGVYSVSDILSVSSVGTCIVEKHLERVWRFSLGNDASSHIFYILNGKENGSKTFICHGEDGNLVGVHPLRFVRFSTSKDNEKVVEEGKEQVLNEIVNEDENDDENANENQHEIGNENDYQESFFQKIKNRVGAVTLEDLVHKGTDFLLTVSMFSIVSYVTIRLTET